jgi:hypothetical protein
MPTAHFVALFLLAPLTACGAPKGEGPRRCNGSAAACERRLDEITVAGAHNAMSNAEEGWLFPNQSWSVQRQLGAGVRGLNLDVYDEGGVATLCHGYCSLGSEPLVDLLLRVNEFLDEEPDEVLLLTFEAYASPALVEAAFRESGLRSRVISPDGPDWPTLDALVEADQRVAVWASDGGGDAGWYRDQWTDWVDNPYAVARDEALPCEADRGQPSNPFFNLNHFITDPVASAEDAALVNAAAVLTEHIDRCTAEIGRPPSQVLVDFVDLGDAIAVVAQMNEG